MHIVSDLLTAKTPPVLTMPSAVPGELLAFTFHVCRFRVQDGGYSYNELSLRHLP